MNSCTSKGPRGTAFIEAMIVVTIIAILLGLIIPNLIVKIQADRHRGTLQDIEIIAKACLEYIKENGKAPASGVQSGPLSPGNAFIKALEEKNLATFPIKDRWGNPFIVYSGSASGRFECFRDDTISGKSFIIVSYGGDGVKETFHYDPANPQAGWFEVSCMSDFKRDLINWNGTWIRRPRPR